MNYTVHELAKLSGVSIRALRYYDEIGLLKPAYIGENKYRYYQEEQLLRLQQILFFKELGLELKQIQQILKRTDFDKLRALKGHAQELKKRMERLKKMAITIDKTIKHLEEKEPMNEQEWYYGFDSEQQKKYAEEIFEKYGETAVQLHEKYKYKTEDWDEKEWDDYRVRSEQLYDEFGDALEKGLTYDSPQVQKLVAKHYALLSELYHPTKEIYSGLGDLYTSDERFRKFFQRFHDELPEFLSDAMKLYAEKNL